MNLLQLGSLPSCRPQPPAESHVPWISAVPFIIVGGAVLAMLISVLFRYNERFREFWTRHVCAFMEKHAVHRDETKGGR